MGELGRVGRTLWQGAAVPALVLAGAAAHAEPLRGSSLGLPHDASAHGWQIDWLLNITLVFVGILFAIMVGWMLIACLRHNKNHPAVYSHGDSKKSVLATLGVAGLVFFTVDGNLFVNSTLGLEHVFWNFTKVEDDPRTVRVEVNAHQWVWDFRHGGRDGRFNTPDDIVSTNVLRVPVDTPVLLQLASTDVIHSFSLPNFRVKQDVVPGSVNRLWFEAKETGEFSIACAQHCGVNHYKMRGTLVVMAPDAYAAWEKEATDDAVRRHDPRDEGARWGWEWKKK